jgi:hypothetical protein
MLRLNSPICARQILHKELSSEQDQRQLPLIAQSAIHVQNGLEGFRVLPEHELFSAHPLDAVIWEVVGQQSHEWVENWQHCSRVGVY